jgi:uncharacterized YccA/Bax inhibitor family protein
MIGGRFGGFVVALFTNFKKEWSPVTAPVYALLEGLALGGISAMFELRYPGIAIQAVGLTFGTLFVLLLAYKSGIIRATQGFKVGVIAATGGIAVLYRGYGSSLFQSSGHVSSMRAGRGASLSASLWLSLPRLTWCLIST